MAEVVVVDVGLGNIASVANMLSHLGHEPLLRSTPEGLDQSCRYVLPGVGSFDEGIRRLQKSGWFDHLKALPRSVEILGICLGMQLLGENSEEGVLSGLGRIPGTFTRFDSAVRVPHMGWNTLVKVADDRIFDPAIPAPRFYFSHTYRANCPESVVLAEAVYGGRFPAAYRSEGTRGVQFHPEKSHKFGLSLMSRWMESEC